MPGLVAVLDFHGRDDLDRRFTRQLQACRQLDWHTMEHWREPEGRAALGRIDLGVFNRAPQPIESHDRRFRLLFVGECYDRAAKLAELCATGVPLTGLDNADLLLATYLHAGLAGVSKLNGSFFFVLWEPAASKLIVGGDRHGSRPHLYRFAQDRFFLAPELTGVLEGSGPAPLSLAGLASFLAMEHPIADLTPFEGVKVFPGGTYLTLTPEGPHWQTFWRPRYRGADEPRPRPLHSWIDEAVHRFARAIGRVADGPALLPLSGGSDSRTIAAFLPEKLPSFTYGTEASHDVVYARQVASTLGLDHRVVLPQDDYIARFAAETVRWGGGMVSIFHAHTLDGLEEARGLAPVSLYGMTAEFFRSEQLEFLLSERARSPLHRLALLGGHLVKGHRPLMRIADEDAWIDHLVGGYWKAVPPAIASELLDPAVVSAMERALRDELGRYFADVAADCALDRLATFNVEMRQRRFSNWGVKTSNSYLEFRKPFDDYELVDFMLGLPHATRRTVQVEVLKRAAPALAAIPRTGTYQPLTAPRWKRAIAFASREIANTLRPTRTQTFADPNAQLRGPSRAFIEDLLRDPRTRQCGFVQPAGLERLLDDHLAGRVEAATSLCAIATLALFTREFSPWISESATLAA